MAHDVIIYTTDYCPYCVKAKKLLMDKGIQFEEIDVTNDPALRQEMESRSGRHTVPQLFIQGKAIGGCDDLYALEHTGKLDSLLSS